MPAELKKGLYESLLTRSVNEQLQGLAGRHLAAESQAVDPAERSRIYTDYAARTVKEALAHCDSAEEARALVNLLSRTARDFVAKKSGEALVCADTVAEDRLLTEVREMTSAAAARPQTSVAHTALLTGTAKTDPALASEIKREIASADRIDWLVSFIRFSAVSRLYDDLKAFTQRGGRLRVITTTYIGATEVKAVEMLAKLPNAEIRIEYSGSRTRHHAKAYLFHRETGFSTAYIGSSNLSGAALTGGLEWNLKLAAKETPEIFAKAAATFEAYWSDARFETFVPDRDDERLRTALKREACGGKRDPAAPVTWGSFEPYPYQAAVLEALAAERSAGHTRNLVVAATGTGKTAIAAFDYQLQIKNGICPKLLFVAHRKEILLQAQACFRSILRDANFGSLMTGDAKPADNRAVFASVQTLKNPVNLTGFARDHFDMVVADETHHAAADSYDTVLEYFTPKILLGLTATPERADGRSILGYFDGRIAAEIRLPEAIEQNLLVPFNYFVLTDPVSLADIPWRSGHFDVKALENRYTQGDSSKARTQAFFTALETYAPEKEELRAVVFCVTQEHARYVTGMLAAQGYKAMAVTAETPSDDRERVKERLEKGEVEILCTVDVLSEGADFPCINTVVFLRPTESLTVFLQQLGRGLRKYPQKDALTVLDFVAAGNRRFSFESRYRALLRTADTGVVRQIVNGFDALPAGCSVTMERVAKETVLENIRQCFTGKKGLLNLAQSFMAEGRSADLAAFLRFAELSLSDFYDRACDTFASFRLLWDVACGSNINRPLPEGITQAKLGKALLRLATTEDPVWGKTIVGLLADDSGVPADEFENSALRAFVRLIWDERLPCDGNDYLAARLKSLRQVAWLTDEIRTLLTVKAESCRREMKDLGVAGTYLKVHGTYHRSAVLAALKPEQKNLQAGVLWIPEKRVDVFFVTINKSEKHFTANTLYEDLALTDTVFQWQSQNSTTDTSPTGERYIHHAERASDIVLFVRGFKGEGKIADPYVCLGKVKYLSHTGNRPMTIRFALEEKLTGELLTLCRPYGD